MKSYQQYKNNFITGMDNYHENGSVVAVIPPLVKVEGLPNVKYGEVVYFESGEMGIVLSMEIKFCEILLFSRDVVSIGTKVSRSGSNFQVKLTEEYIGKNISPVGDSFSEDIIFTKKYDTLPIEQKAPGMELREKITRQFVTGVSVVDLMVPLGCGQRELVLGDRQTGKTEFLLQTLLTQANKGTLCIYANVGKKKGDIHHVENFIKTNKIENNTIIVSSSSTDPLGFIYVTPYVAMTMGEYFVKNGRDVLLILDDLSTHAKFYREISLLAKRFPGRNSYPGDIFYAHSRLLERAGNFKTSSGENSLTCLAAAETIQSDISGYIQTNLMSITDGHIYFDQALFGEGRRPAINYFLSVTRVGRQTQNKLRSGLSRELNSFMSLYEKTQRFIHFGAEINEGIKTTLSLGQKLLTLFDQSMGNIIDQNVQIVLVSLIWVGALKAENMSKVKAVRYRGQDLYTNDEQFRTLIDTIISTSTDFNSLLGHVSAKNKELLKYFPMDTSK